MLLRRCKGKKFQPVNFEPCDSGSSHEVKLTEESEDISSRVMWIQMSTVRPWPWCSSSIRCWWPPLTPMPRLENTAPTWRRPRPLPCSGCSTGKWNEDVRTSVWRSTTLLPGLNVPLFNDRRERKEESYSLPWIKMKPWNTCCVLCRGQTFWQRHKFTV